MAASVLQADLAEQPLALLDCCPLSVPVLAVWGRSSPPTDRDLH